MTCTRFPSEVGCWRQHMRRNGICPVAAQHHHAHIAAIAAEHGLREPVLGLALDGVGLGPERQHLGCRELAATGDKHFERLGHLRPLPVPQW
ncbi:MAG: hypothetical protein R3F36_00765 [Candidatus Competibacteraceae bacterium]